MDWIRIFCLRLCHDLLTPVGAMQLSVDMLKTDFTKENLSLMEQSMQSTIGALDLVRKAYGYESAFANVKEILQMLEDTFGKKINVDCEVEDYGKSIDGAWSKDIFRLMLWLRYKTTGSSRIYCKLRNNEMICKVEKVFLTDSEEKIFYGEEVPVDSYLIYLMLFFKYLSKGTSVSMDKEDETYLFKLTRN